METMADYSDSYYVEQGTMYLVDKVDFMFAPYSTSLFEKSASITEPNKKLLISGTASHVPSPNNYSFSVIAGDIYSIETGIQAFKSLGAKSIGVLKAGTDRCQKTDVESVATAYNM